MAGQGLGTGPTCSGGVAPALEAASLSRVASLSPGFRSTLTRRSLLRNVCFPEVVR